MFIKGRSTLLMQRPPTAWISSDAMPALVFSTGLAALLGSGIPVANRDALATALIFLIVVSVDRALRGRRPR